MIYTNHIYQVMAALLLLHLITKEERVNSTVKGLFPDIFCVSENLVSPQHYSHCRHQNFSLKLLNTVFILL